MRKCLKSMRLSFPSKASHRLLALLFSRRCMSNVVFRHFLCSECLGACVSIKCGVFTSVRYKGTKCEGYDALQEDPSSGPGSSNPMETLTRVFRTHPTALRLHRELTISLANANPESAAEVASALAQTIGRVVDKETKHRSIGSSMNFDSKKDKSAKDKIEFPPPSPDDLNETMTAAERGMIKMLSSVDPSPYEVRTQRTTQNVDSLDSSLGPFWRSPDYLCITVLESMYETIPSGDNEGNPLTTRGDLSITNEGKEVAILNEYLLKEADRLRAQKSAVVKTVLEVARSVGLTPEDLHASESTPVERALSASSEHLNQQAQGTASLNVIRHCNLIIRAEAPDMSCNKDSVDLDAKVCEELSILKKRMRESGAPLSEKEEKMATYELRMMHTTMRYVVGLHRDTQLALDHSVGVRESQEKVNAQQMKGSSFFIQKLLEALHLTPEQATEQWKDNVSDDCLSVEKFEQVKAMREPVLPFTYVLKCCLWFDIPSPNEI